MLELFWQIKEIKTRLYYFVIIPVDEEVRRVYPERFNIVLRGQSIETAVEDTWVLFPSDHFDRAPVELE